MSGHEDAVTPIRKMIEASQQEVFPYFVEPQEVFGLTIQINKGVFSPRYAKGYSFFTPRLPSFADKKVLEIGSGHGITACYIAESADSVLATDITSEAVENTRINAAHNKRMNLEARVSDVYSALKGDEKFDAIYWNIPWVSISSEFAHTVTPVERGAFDPGYESISRFILQGRQHLTPEGSLYLGFGEKGANVEKIESLITHANLSKEVLADEEYQPATVGGETPAPIRMRLYKLTPRI